MGKAPSFRARGYLEKSYLDKDGAKHLVFEVSAGAALECAKLELMARDLVNHQPVLLEIVVKQSLAKGLEHAGRKKQAQAIR